MSANYHTPYQDGVTEYKAAHMNVPIGELDEQIGTNVSDIAKNSSDISSLQVGPYIMGLFWLGTLENSQTILVHAVTTQAFELPSGLSGSIATAELAAAAETVLSIKKNGAEIGTITFAAAGSSGVLAMASAQTFSSGDKLSIVGPASADETLAGLSISLKAARTTTTTTTTTTP